MPACAGTSFTDFQVQFAVPAKSQAASASTRPAELIAKKSTFFS
jgi:hypothetical protein